MKTMTENISIKMRNNEKMISYVYDWEFLAKPWGKNKSFAIRNLA